MVFAFEGLDGSGKTTLIKSLSDYYKDSIILKRYNVNDISNIWKDLIQKNMLNKFDSCKISAYDFFISQKIATYYLENNRIVLFDRYIGTQLSYYKYFGVSIEYYLAQIDGFCIIPDMTFILKISPEISWNRLNKKKIPSIYEFGLNIFNKDFKSLNDKFLNYSENKKKNIFIEYQKNIILI
jgi:thymidylate kinase